MAEQMLKQSNNLNRRPQRITYRYFTEKPKKIENKPNLAPVCGRQHAEMQTSLYLEQLSMLIEEDDIESQTDPFISRPPTPLFVRQKSGVDKSTEILPLDLFSFRIEVGPMMEVLIGKTIEQSMLEVEEEEELANIRRQISHFSEMRNADLLEQQRLEESDRRIRIEKERRREQHIELEKQRKKLAEKISARSFTSAYLGEIVPSVYENLRKIGYIHDPVEKDIFENFMPWLIDAVIQELSLDLEARKILDQLIREVCSMSYTHF